MRLTCCFLLITGCGGAAVGEIEALEGQFENGRRPDFGGTIYAWKDETFFNAGYQERETPALEVLATRSRFDPSQDLLRFEGDAFLDLQKDFLFADAFRLRLADAQALDVGKKFQVDSESPDPNFLFALKMGAEPMEEGVARDDPREAFRLPGHLEAGLEVLDRSEQQIQFRLNVSAKRCEDFGEGPAYLPGEFVVTFTAPLLGERLSEHNVKVLLGLSTVPLPDPNGFSFPGFTQNCNNNPRPPID